jgi:hypothetical protein
MAQLARNSGETVGLWEKAVPDSDGCLGGWIVYPGGDLAKGGANLGPGSVKLAGPVAGEVAGWGNTLARNKIAKAGISGINLNAQNLSHPKKNYLIFWNQTFKKLIMNS